VNASARFLNPSEAAARLGVSAKALRLYEQRDLITPTRSAAGWRAYGPDEMTRLGEIVALRVLGLSLAQVARVLAGHASELETALAAHQTGLEEQMRRSAATIDTVRGLRIDLAQGRPPASGVLARMLEPVGSVAVAFDLPWPWGGERFELHQIRPLTYITGPLGSGKTRLARRLAEVLPDAGFLGLDRLLDGDVEPRARLDGDASLAALVDRTLTWLVEDGATISEALVALVIGLEAENSGALVVDMVEQGLDHATQEAMIAHLRRRDPSARPLFLLTRSSVILDLAALGPGEAVLFCPANHSPPIQVAPYRGAPGYEAVASCLALPDVRARTEGVIAWRPQVA
jgi:DNA-binding transcriptional MerR regulator